MDQHVIMGIPVEIPEGFPIPEFQPYKGSIQVAADCCGAIVWQGPAQQALKAEHPEYPIHCAICLAREVVRAGSQPTIVTLTDKKAGE